MFKTHNPCKECKHTDDKCTKCALHNLQINYQRALEEIIKLKTRLGESVTILK